MRIRGIAWEGGGILALAYLRPLAALDAELQGGLSSVPILAGTSAGAITACLVALGATPQQIEAVVRQTPYAELAQNSWGVFRDTWRLLRTGGWNRLDRGREWLSETIVGLGHHRDLTFGALAHYHGRELHVCAVNESKGRLDVLGPRTTPATRILDGVLASMAIPIYWPPVAIDGQLYSDGGLINNHPIDVLEQRGLAPDEVLGFALDSTPRGPETPATTWPIARAKRLVRLLLAAARRGHVPTRYWPRVVKIDCGSHGPTDFAMSLAQREWLIDAGERAWISWKRRAAA